MSRPAGSRIAVLLLVAALLGAGCGQAAPPLETGLEAGGGALLSPVDMSPASTAPPEPPASLLSAGARTTAPARGADPGPGPDRAPDPGPPSGAAEVAPAPAPPPPAAGGGADVRAPERYAISCDQDEATVAASGAPRVSRGAATIYIGTQQVSGDNQDPRLVRFDGGRQTWCRDDLERSGDDGRGYGLLWSGDVLLGVFTATGTQGEPARDLRRFTGSGWLRHYSDASPGGGGGPRASAIVRLDPDTGAGVPGTGTWLTARTEQGKVNSLVVTSLALAGGGVRVGVRSWYSPRAADRSPLRCEGESPFAVTYTFDLALTSVSDVRTDGRCR